MKKKTMLHLFQTNVVLSVFISCEILYANIKSFIIKVLFQDSFLRTNKQTNKKGMKIFAPQLNNTVFVSLVEMK